VKDVSTVTVKDVSTVTVLQLEPSIQVSLVIKAKVCLKKFGC